MGRGRGRPHDTRLPRTDMANQSAPGDARKSVAAGAPLAISSGNRARSGWAWLWAALAAAASATVLYFGTRSPLDWEHDYPLIYAVLGVTCGGTLFLVGRALIATLRAHKFGEATLELDGAAPCLGGQITGRLIVGPAIRVGSDGEMTLKCQEVVTVQTTQDKTRTETQTHYQMAKPFVVEPSAATSGIPVRFDVPVGARATDEGLTRWVLSVTVAVPGLDADMTFEIPVQR